MTKKRPMTKTSKRPAPGSRASRPAAAAPAAAARSIEYLKVDSITESPSNPRKIFNGIDELSADIARRGVLQPILVRPAPRNRYELVFGARRLRASKQAGLKEIPAVIQEMDDRQVLETQVIENQQREDVHPLEEADGYRALHEKHQVDVDELAARVGKSRSYVYQRLKLCSLGDRAREAFLEGKLSASTALLVARIQPDKLQQQALKEITETRWGGDEPMSFREAASHIQRNYMLELGSAGFDTADPLLLTQAGACSTCPKRTGNQVELFSDVKSADVCTDPACFKLKRDADWKRRQREAKTTGVTVLSKEQTEKVFPKGYGGPTTHISYDSGYVDLDDSCDADLKHRPWRKLIGKQAAELETVLARDGAGKARVLVKRTEAQRALKAAGHDLGRRQHQPHGRSEEEIAYANRSKRREAILRELKTRIRDQIVAGVEARGEMSLADWRAITRGIVATSWSDTCAAIVRRRCIDRESGQKSDTVRALVSWIDGATEPELRALVVELALERADTYHLREAIEDTEGIDPERQAEIEEIVDEQLGDQAEDYDSLEEMTWGGQKALWSLETAAELFGVDAKAVQADAIRDVDRYLETALNKKRTKEIKKRAKAGAEPKGKKSKTKPKDQKSRAAGERDDDAPELEVELEVEHEGHVEDHQEQPDVRTCKGCGCTDDYGCNGGCYWVSADLCSACDGENE